MLQTRIARRVAYRRAALVATFLVVASVLVLVGGTAGATITSTYTGFVDASGTKFKQHLFDVVDAGEIDVSLDWSDTSADLNLFLYRKETSGTYTLVAQSTTKNRPETIAYPSGTVGTWKIGVKAITGASAYTATVSHSPSATPPPPGGVASYTKTFGYPGSAGNYAYGGDWDPSTNTMLWGDYWNYRVKRYTIDGQKCTPTICDGSPLVVTTVKPVSTLGGSTAPYDVETDMYDLDNQGRASFWVADQGSFRIVQYGYTGQWLQTIGKGGGGSDAAHPGHDYAASCGNGNMLIPTHMWVDPSNGHLYVSDPSCRNVYVFTHTGDFLFEFNWGGWKTLTGLSTPIPRGVAGGRDYNGDGQGDVYVVEHNSRRVVVFSKSGAYLGAFPRVDQMNDPRGLDVDPTTGNVVTVSAYKNRVFVFDYQTGALLKSWGDMDGPNSSAMNDQPYDSIRFPAVDGQGNIYVGDTWGGRLPDPRTGSTWYGYRVYKYDSNYNPVSWATGPEPPPDGGYNQQNGVAVDPAGELFVVDTFEQRVQKFDTSKSCPSEGNCAAWMLQFGSREPAGPTSSGFGYPRTLTFGDGDVWVGDNNNAVLAWTANGTFVHRFGSQGSALGQFKGGVQGILVPGDGRIYTTDIGNCRLQVFDEATAMSQSFPQPLTAMGSCGTGANQMSAPRGVEVDGNTAYVVETGTSRISVWNLTAKTSTTVRPACGGTGLKQPWGITWDPARTWLYIGDLGNARIVRWSPSTGTCQVVTTGADAPSGWRGPNYVTFGPDGLLYASDNSRHVYAFTINS